MPMGFIFWLLMLLWLIFGMYWNRGDLRSWAGDGNPLLFILLFLLGWKVFGFMIQ